MVSPLVSERTQLPRSARSRGESYRRLSARQRAGSGLCGCEPDCGGAAHQRDTRSLPCRTSPTPGASR